MTLSILIPTLNEQDTIEPCLRSLRAEFSGEILVIDGGSTDQTLDRATTGGATRVHSSPPGLARQCNLGADRAKGEVFFFLAADSCPGRGWLRALEEALHSPSVVAGGFRLVLDAPGPVYRLLEWGGNYRARRAGLALPDQGLFVRRSAFENAGGMRFDSRIPFARLCHDLKTEGEFHLLSHPVHSSVRKWRAHGIARTTWHHFRVYREFRRREIKTASRTVAD